MLTKVGGYVFFGSQVLIAVGILRMEACGNGKVITIPIHYSIDGPAVISGLIGRVHIQGLLPTCALCTHAADRAAHHTVLLTMGTPQWVLVDVRDELRIIFKRPEHTVFVAIRARSNDLAWNALNSSGVSACGMSIGSFIAI